MTKPFMAENCYYFCICSINMSGSIFLSFTKCGFAKEQLVIFLLISSLKKRLLLTNYEGNAGYFLDFFSHFLGALKKVF